MTEQPENLDNPATAGGDLDEEEWPAENLATESDALVEQTDNSGEPEVGDAEVPQGPGDVSDDDLGDDEDDEEVGDGQQR